MTRQEAGRRGGLRVFELYGREHMQRIGERGFDQVARNPARAHLGYGAVWDPYAWLVHKLRTTYYAAERS